MVINESAYYKGKLWCAYELKDHFGRYHEELRLHMRKESQERKFTCPDCGEPLILCAGPIMEPFFKHYENSKCIINRTEVNRRNIVARRMLFHLAKDSYKEAIIEVDKKLDEGISPDIWIMTQGVTIVFEYLSYESKLAVWEAKHNYYKENGIIDVWFLNFKKYQYEVKTTFEYMVSKHTNRLKFIDYETGELIIKENYSGVNGSNKFITKSYPITEVQVDLKGEVICDYEVYRKEQLELLLYEENLKKIARIEAAVKRNQITEPVTSYQQMSFTFDLIEEEEEKERNLSIKLGTKAKVKRYSLDSDKVNSRTMKMPAIHELWELPSLIGNDVLIRKANQKRYLYLKQLNRELENLSKEKQERKIQIALSLLENKIDVMTWK